MNKDTGDITYISLSTTLWFLAIDLDSAIPR